MMWKTEKPKRHSIWQSEASNNPQDPQPDSYPGCRLVDGSTHLSGLWCILSWVFVT